MGEQLCNRGGPKICLCLFCSLFVLFLTTRAQTTRSVALCEVLDSPDKYDKQTIQIQGYAHLAFEDFTFTSKECPKAFPGIWLIYGGDVPTPTMSTVNDTRRKRGTNPIIEGIPVPLTKDGNFDRFQTLLAARKERDESLYQVTATLTGTFFEGNSKTHAGGGRRPGYGHLGGFFLFVISHVDEVESDPPAQMTVAGTVRDAEGRPVTGVDVISHTVNCCQALTEKTKSNDSGAFELRTAGQVMTFTKSGYSPKSLVLVNGNTNLEVVIDSRGDADFRIPACGGTGAQEEFQGFPIRLTIPEGMHSDQLSETPGKLYIIHKDVRGPALRLALAGPEDRFGQTAIDIFYSQKFTQRNVLDADGKWIGLDTSGSDEKRLWRILAIPGKAVISYDEYSTDTAHAFDQAIDSACFNDAYSK